MSEREEIELDPFETPADTPDTRSVSDHPLGSTYATKAPSRRQSTEVEGEGEAANASDAEDGLSASGNNTERQLPTLPDVDTSKEAWFYVVASFVEEMLLWGPLLATGVYLKYYAASETFASASEVQISLIGTLAPCFAFGSGMPLLYMYNYFPRFMIPSMWAGLALFSLSLLAGSFVSDIRLLIVFQGVFPGIAAALAAFPLIRWIPEWFDKRKGIATGVIFSGGGVGGLYMPFLYDLFLSRLGYKWSLRIFAISTAVIASIAISFIKPRVPISSRSQIKRAPMPDFWQTFTSWGFLCLFLSSLLQAFGYFNVALFLPRFSDALSSSEGAGLLGAFNVCCLISQILWGHLTDKIKPSLAMSLSSGLGTLFVLFLWGFSTDSLGIKVLMPFAIVFGLSTGGFSSMWSQCAHELAGDGGVDKEKQSLLWSGLSLARGIGAVIGPTLGSALYRDSSLTKSHRWGSAGSPPLVALVAASLAGSSLIPLIYHFSKRALVNLKSGLKDKDKNENRGITTTSTSTSDRDRDARAGQRRTSNVSVTTNGGRRVGKFEKTRPSSLISGRNE
ncbi:uncharacterized protein I303_108286 [Kwoniella dejecticola CBS 10117]|uniref:Major facilitator superfamily (MFS) profile domain-containing protein n=1 Tax=Kwoniella dejecticola CBS 10117 TaxID=1296121 RepID=A0A1A5ZXU1_9TREE|nr:uncharacterized protein I303_07387 [Kwoniella dejecticola CBS 10117]OBR82625.1 hypothetical protein I303_07387 [Kwoniella dejecticola CBS 10117]